MNNSDRFTVKVLKVTPAGDSHQVITAESKGIQHYQRKPCKNCPWRVDAVGEFPPEAFIHSAITAYDMSTHTFGCHSSGSNKLSTCAGFLIKGAEHNLSVRLALSKGVYVSEISDGGNKLFENYREMAIANGVDPDDPSLKQCRD